MSDYAINRKPLEELRKSTIEAMALYINGCKPDGVAQEIDRLIIDCIQMRCCFNAVDSLATDVQRESILFQSFQVGTIYSVGIMLRKLMDNQNGTCSMMRLWSNWYNDLDGKSCISNTSSEAEVDYIWSVLKDPGKSKYSGVYLFLQTALAHNQKANQKNIEWSAIDDLIRFNVRVWEILVRASGNFYLNGVFLEWGNVNHGFQYLVDKERISESESAWNEFRAEANKWRFIPIN
ncbi:hypothetical protein [Pseudomonas sp. S3_C01]